MRYLVFAAVVAAALLAPRPASANGAPAWSAEQLAGFAEVVVVARVDDLTSSWDHDANAIYTFVGVTVDHVLKGSVPTDRIVVKQLGGRVGETGLHVADQADFQVGETVLLFLEVRPRDGTLYTSGLWQGKWTLEGSWSGDRIATRRAPESLEASADRLLLSTIERAVGRAPVARASSAIEFEPAADRLAVASEDAQISHSFTLLGPLRYTYSPTVDAETGGQPGLPGGGINEMLTAIARWNNAGSTFQFGIGAANAAPRCSTHQLRNGRVTISFMDPCNEMSDGGGTLAIGGSYYTPGAGGSVNGEEFNRASEGFIVLNNSATALRYLTVSGCFDDVITHELGHVLGLGHSVDPNAIMFPSVSQGCLSAPRGLGQDDVDGITYIYGFRASARATAPASAPANVEVALDGASSVTVSWLPVNDLENAIGATVYRVEFRSGHADGGPLIASFTTRRTALTVGIPPGLTGDFNVVVVPANADGGGPASFRTDFSICGSAPLPVTNLMAAVANGVAQISWDNSPGATSYQIQAGSQPGLADLQPLVNLGAVTTVHATVPSDLRAWIRVIAVNGCAASAPVDVLLEARD